MIFGFESLVTEVAISCSHPLIRDWLPCVAKTYATRSQPHPENERQQSVNNFWSGIVGNLTWDWVHTSISEIFDVFRGENTGNMLGTPS